MDGTIVKAQAPKRALRRLNEIAGKHGRWIAPSKRPDEAAGSEPETENGRMLLSFPQALGGRAAKLLTRRVLSQILSKQDLSAEIEIVVVSSPGETE